MSPHELTTAANALRNNTSQQPDLSNQSATRPRDLSNQSAPRPRDEGVANGRAGGGVDDVWEDGGLYGVDSGSGNRNDVLTRTRQEALQLLAHKRTRQPSSSTSTPHSTDKRPRGSGDTSTPSSRGDTTTPNSRGDTTTPSSRGDRRGVRVPPSSKRPRLALQSEFLEGDEENMSIGVDLPKREGEREEEGRGGPSGRRRRNQRLMELESDDEEEENEVESSGQDGGLEGGGLEDGGFLGTRSSGNGNGKSDSSSSEDEHDLVICQDSN